MLSNEDVSDLGAHSWSCQSSERIRTRVQGHYNVHSHLQTCNQTIPKSSESLTKKSNPSRHLRYPRVMEALSSIYLKFLTL